MIRYGFLFTTLGIAVLTFAALASRWGWASTAMSWVAANFIAVGLAYWTRFHGIFGKRRDGSLSNLNVILFLPFLLLTWATWHVVRLLSRESATDRVERDVILARRLIHHEMPDEADVVIDLTAEFSEPRTSMGAKRYLAFPILDAGVPAVEALQMLLDELPPSGTVLVHCAQGHGRTAMVSACLLLRRGYVASAAAAVDRILSARPAARMNRQQRSLVTTYERALAYARSPGVEIKTSIE